MKESAATQGIRDLIARVARQLGVPVDVALAFAYVESRFNPKAEGDLKWAFKRAAKYRELVLDAPRFAQNPWRTDAARWHSYGLFGLLAAYHTRDNEDPRALLNPQVNAERGLAEVKRLLAKYGSVERARLAYVGCGPDGDKCDEAYAAKVVHNLAQALERYRGAA